jgi:site-specific recombinase XerD
VDAGASLDRVAQILGHESVDTTRIYTTLSDVNRRPT